MCQGVSFCIVGFLILGNVGFFLIKKGRILKRKSNLYIEVV